MTEDKLRERLLLVPVDPDDASEAVAELDRLEAENARKSALLDQLAEAVEALLGIIGPGQRVKYPNEVIDASQALATYRESVK